MTGYKIFVLNDMIKQLGEEKTKKILSNFSCPKNIDVEKFIVEKSIEFAKQKIASTHIVFTSVKNKLEIVGYFTLTNKTIFVKTSKLSKTLRRRISKFGSYDEILKGYIIAAPLIAQLGKNFADGLDKHITGDELLKLACNKVQDIQNNIGGKVTYLECEDKLKLKEFYKSNGFVDFGTRKLDKDEKDDLSGEYLVQMLKYI